MAFGQEVKNQSLQFNGLYKTECEIDKDDDEGTQSYLRFYPDGKVLSVSTDCEASASDLKDWFNYENKDVSIGSYKSKRLKIQFSVTSKAGTVKYRGRIDKNGLIKLRSKSLINGHKDREKYRFIQQNDMK
jgi:TusA-related sulfurtransferase